LRGNRAEGGAADATDGGEKAQDSGGWRMARKDDLRWEYVLQKFSFRVLPIMLASFLLYPIVANTLASGMDSIALQVIKGDVSQFMQNFFNFNGLLFSFFISTTYSVLYGQQEQLYLALYAEASEAKSLMEQLTLVSQSRPNYRALLQSMRDYVEEMLVGVRLGCPPAVLVSARPISDPLENILYLTSVGTPSVVYDTVKSLRECRGVRLGMTQRKLPPEHFWLLYVLGALELLAFPLLGAGISTIEPAEFSSLPGHIMWVQAVVFACLSGCVILALEIVQDLTSPSEGLYNLDNTLVDMVESLGHELQRRLNAAPQLAPRMVSLVDDRYLSIPYLRGAEGGPSISPLGMPEAQRGELRTATFEASLESLEPQADQVARGRMLLIVGGAGILATIIFPFVVLFLQHNFSEGALLSIREDNNAQWLQNFFTGIGFVFSLFVTQTFSFLYGQQEQIYLALYAEVSVAKALLEQLALVCKMRPDYSELLEGLQSYVRNDLQRFDRRPSNMIAAGNTEPLEKVLWLTSVGTPSYVYETVRGVRQARGARLGAAQQKLPRAHFFLLAVLGSFELSIFPVLSAGCSALDPNALLPGHILFFHSLLFGMMTSAMALTLNIMWDLWTPIGNTYNIESILKEMVRGLEDEIQIRLEEPRTKECDMNDEYCLTEDDDFDVDAEYGKSDFQLKSRKTWWKFGSSEPLTQLGGLAQWP